MDVTGLGVGSPAAGCFAIVVEDLCGVVCETVGEVSWVSVLAWQAAGCVVLVFA